MSNEPRTIINMESCIAGTCHDLSAFLCEKNRCYGDSANNPVRVFSKADKLEAMGVRIDDKLSRIARGSEYPGDDTIKDLAGYLVLLMAIKRYDEQTKAFIANTGIDPTKPFTTVASKETI